MRYAIVIVAIALITALDFRLRVNHTTVALMFLVTVLLLRHIGDCVTQW